MSKHKTVSILGCGWLGLPLARALINEGYQVKGSTTQAEKIAILQAEGILPFLVQLSPTINENHDPAFFRSDVLIVNVPPGRRRDNVESFYPAQVQAIIDQQPSRKIIFVSSTSVYPDLNREVSEADSPSSEDEAFELRSSGKALLRAERLIREYSSDTTIVRFCGLMGPDRHPGRFLAGKQLSSSGQDPVNFIHQDDCVAIVRELVQQQAWGETFNACSDGHPSKEVFYTRATGLLGEPPPQFEEEGPRSYKQVNSEKIKQRLNYRFRYSNPSEGL